jgi:PAS domain S-box-containing protein
MRSPVPRVEHLQASPKWGPRPQEPGNTPWRTFEDFEDWDNFTNNCSVGLHAVDGQGIIVWANDTELKYLGYEPEEYIGRFIGDFHVDRDVVRDILERLNRDETINAYPVRLRAKDGSTKFVMLNSNVYRQKGGRFGHTRCFSVHIDGATWRALKKQWEKKCAA